jgi:hemolysin III
MANHTPHADHEHPPFSLPLFIATILASLLLLLGALKLFLPGYWEAQFLAPFWKGLVAFLALSLLNCYVEYVFHRYVLHKPAVPFLRRFYRQHTLHHALTRIARKPVRDGRGIMFIENKYPILEVEQHEASFFPWYTLVTFACILAPLYCLLQWAAPSFPWFFAGFAALASSLAIYELVHAIEHWPLEKWEPLILSPRWGFIWRPAYSFHLRHHAVIDCNESISGFFCLPLADWTFGTCLMPRSIYSDGEEWSADEFTSPRPVWPVRMLDEAADRAVRRHRAGATGEDSPPAERRPGTRGERIANWVTQGLGLALGTAALALLIGYSCLNGDAWQIASCSVFGLTTFLLFFIYTLYHAWRTVWGRRFFLKLARASVFLLVAGTYTPFLLVSMRGPWGWTVFAIVWGLCGAGAVFQFFIGNRFRVTSTLAALFVGWMVLLAIKPLVASVPHGAIWLLVAGGLCYTAGPLLMLAKRLRYKDAFRNAFVLCGSTCHILAVLLFVLPHHA